MNRTLVRDTTGHVRLTGPDATGRTHTLYRSVSVRSSAVGVSETMTMTKTTTGLSALQRRILLTLFDDYLTGWPWGSWGGGMRWRQFDEARRTRAGQAARSRALARLETRGLVQRLNCVRQGPRTTHVLLLPAGVELAERLTQRRGVWELTVGANAQPEPMSEAEYHARRAAIEADPCR